MTINFATLASIHKISNQQINNQPPPYPLQRGRKGIQRIISKGNNYKISTITTTTTPTTIKTFTTPATITTYANSNLPPPKGEKRNSAKNIEGQLLQNFNDYNAYNHYNLYKTYNHYNAYNHYTAYNNYHPSPKYAPIASKVSFRAFPS